MLGEICFEMKTKLTKNGFVFSNVTGKLIHILNVSDKNVAISSNSSLMKSTPLTPTSPENVKRCDMSTLLDRLM